MYATRVDASGQVRDPSGVSVAGSEYALGQVAVGSNGQSFLVAWGSYDNVNARLLSSDGPALGTAFVVSSATNAQRNPAVASDGTDYFVVWQDFRNDATQGSRWDVYGARVTGAGTVQDVNGLAIVSAPTPDNQLDPQVAFVGGGYLVVWTDGRGSDDDIYGALVTGTQVNPPSGFRITAEPVDQTSPALASTGTQALVVWKDRRNGTSDIYGARVSDTTVLDPGGIVISTAASDQEFPQVAFDGVHYLVVWQHLAGAQTELRGARVALDGTVVDPQDFSVSAEPYDERSPVAASDGNGRTLVAYERYQDFPTLNVTRVRGRIIGLARALGEPCPNAGVCASGFCIDGVCCESACGQGASDCQSCSVAAGATQDGTCGPVAAGTSCGCDPTLLCDGSSTFCPGASRCTGPPRFLSSPLGEARCHVPYLYSELGRPVVEGQGPFTFLLRGADTQPLPAGLFINTESGELSWRPTPGQAGPQVFDLVAQGAEGSAVQRIEVTVTCRPAGPLDLGCGCASAPSLSFLVVLAALSVFRGGGGTLQPSPWQAPRKSWEKSSWRWAPSTSCSCSRRSAITSSGAYAWGRRWWKSSSAPKTT
ncbi:MAG: putative Ig domain-containing protein [Myxococcota bacterium]